MPQSLTRPAFPLLSIFYLLEDDQCKLFQWYFWVEGDTSVREILCTKLQCNTMVTFWGTSVNNRILTWETINVPLLLNDLICQQIWRNCSICVQKFGMLLLLNDQPSSDLQHLSYFGWSQRTVSRQLLAFGLSIVIGCPARYSFQSTLVSVNSLLWYWPWTDIHSV